MVEFRQPRNQQLRCKQLRCKVLRCKQLGQMVGRGFRQPKSQQLRCKRKARQQEAGKRKRSLSWNQMEIQGETNLPLMARMQEETGMGGQLWARQFTDGFRTAGEMGQPGVYPLSRKSTVQESASVKLLADVKMRLTLPCQLLALRMRRNCGDKRGAE